MSKDHLRFRVVDGIAEITINRPEKRNAMSLEMWRMMVKHVEAATHDRSVIAIVLRGVDQTAFAAGADIEEMLDIATSHDAAWELMNAVRDAEQSLSDCPKPSIAMISGICVGGGVELALGCDLRFAARNFEIRDPSGKARIGVQPIVHEEADSTCRSWPRTRSSLQRPHVQFVRSSRHRLCRARIRRCGPRAGDDRVCANARAALAILDPGGQIRERRGACRRLGRR